MRDVSLSRRRRRAKENTRTRNKGGLRGWREDQVFYRFSKSTNTSPAAPAFLCAFDLCVTLKGRLFYLRAALSSHQSSARKKSGLPSPLRYCVRSRNCILDIYTPTCSLLTRVPWQNAMRNHVGIYKTIASPSANLSLNLHRGRLIRRNPV